MSTSGVEIVWSKEQMDQNVADIYILEFDLTVRGDIFGDEHSHPED